jgi:hypothetical protein
MPDLRRREPKNVGVVLRVGDLCLSRFMGERGEGRIDGRHVHGFVSSLQNFKAWVAYWRQTADSEDLVALTRHRADDNYFLECAGKRMLGSEHTVPQDMLDYLYSVLVEDRPEPDTLNVRQLSERVLDRAGIRNQVTEKYRLPVSVTDSALFDNKYEGGSVSLMKRVTLTYDDERSWASAHAAAWDFEKAAFAIRDGGGNLIALIKTWSSDSELKQQLGLLDDLSSAVIDVGQEQEAAAQLTEVIHSG